jgi:hypothetical protein
MTGIRLTPKQADLLRRIVKTNGGGISAYRLHGGERCIMWRLHELGLIQGKSGDLSTCVHTREGLDWVRNEGPQREGPDHA